MSWPWKLLLLAALALAVCSIGGSAGKAGGCPTPELNLIATSSCAVIGLENDAYDAYATAHDIPRGDPRISHDGAVEVVGAFTAMLRAIITAVHDGSPNVTADQRSAYNWYQAIVQDFQVAAAQDALDEYAKWQRDPCNYAPPDATVFTFDSHADPSCGAGLGALFRGPTPPTYSELLSYGEYDAAAAANFRGVAPGANPMLQQAVKDEALRSGLSWLSVLAFPAAAVPAAIFRQELRNTIPSVKIRSRMEQKIKAYRESTKQVTDEIATEDETAGDIADVSEGAAAGEEAADEGGLALSELVEGALDAVIAPATGFFVAGILVTAAIEEGIQVFTEAAIPGQLQANLDSAEKPPDLQDFLDASEALGIELLDNNVNWNIAKAPAVAQTVDHAPVVTTPPDDGTRIQVTYADAAGNAQLTDRERLVPLRTWPVGVAGCTYGCPWVRVAYANGELWRQPTPDEASAGVKGYLPTTVLNYVDWGGAERTAWVQGDHFLDMSGSGSGDLGGSDAGPDCTDTTVCNVAQTLFALGPDDIKLKITLKPDPGTPADLLVNNSLGFLAGPDLTGAHSGLQAGQTAELDDPLTNANGAATTYKWEVETRCPYNTSNDSVIFAGSLALCPGDPGYDTGLLDPSQEDLVIDGHEDPAFHGEPVEIMNGQSVDYTWPAAGTYHVRLITTDAYGHVQIADQDVAIAGAAPTVPLRVYPGLQSPQAFGPIVNGGLAEITGCIVTTAGVYATPSVSVDWGDGTQDSQTGVGTSGTVKVAYRNPTASCNSHWSFDAVHAYYTSSTQQLHVPVVIGDGSGKTRTIDLYVNLIHNVVPGIATPPSATFVAGSVGNFEVATTGDPAPTLTLEDPGDLPSGVGFTGHGLQGATPVGVGGVYRLTFHASNSAGSFVQPFILTVDAAPQITSDASTTLVTGQAGSFRIAASGYPTPAVSVLGSLPSGMQATDNGDGTATISGTPAAGSAGTYDLTVQAASAAGTAQQAFTLAVGDMPAITSPSKASFTIGNAPSSFMVTAAGSPAPSLSCSAPCDLPSGLAFRDNGDGTATIFGAAASGAVSGTVTVKATNSAGSASQQLVVDASLTGGPTVTAAKTDTFAIGRAASYTIGSSDATAALSEDGPLPDGIAFHDNGDGTATLSGTAASGSGGYYALVVSATPSSGPAGLAFVELEVVGPPTLTSPATATFHAGTAGSFTISASGLPRPDIGLSGKLPDGLSFDDPGNSGYATISGTPAAGTAGSYTLEVSAANLENMDSPLTSKLTLVVAEPPAIASAAHAYLAEGADSSFAVATTGSPAPALTVSGDLPPGVTFHDGGDGSGTLSGTPTDTTVETYQVVVQASSIAGEATQALDVSVGPAPAFTSGASASFVAGSEGSFAIGAEGAPGGAAATFAVEGLPSGLSLVDNGDGTATIEGTPAPGTGGVTTAHVTATDEYGSVSQQIALTVDEAPSLVGDTTVELDSAGPFGAAPEEVDFGSAGYPKPSFSLAGDLPPGVTFADNGDGTASLDGAPDAGISGTYPLQLTLENFAGSTTVAVDLVVKAPAMILGDAETTFLAGSPNTFTVTASGDPTPTFRFFGSPPGWLTVTDNGDGTATISGTPPLGEIGDEIDLSTLVQNGIGNGDLEQLAVVVSPIAFTAAAPPAGVVGRSYSYSFAARSSSGESVTYAVADGDSLPAGLALSRGGTLSGTPTTVGPTTFSVVGTTADGDSGSSAPIALTVAPARHELELSEFRTRGPSGMSDWYAKLTNTTSVGAVVDGWKLLVAHGDRQFPVPLSGTLAAGASIVVGGPLYSLPGSADVVGPANVGAPGGFRIVAPDGTAADSAGQVGAPADDVAGTGLAVPSDLDAEYENAYVRKTSGGALVDTGDNAADFAYQQVEAAPFFDQSLSFSPIADHPTTDSPLTLSAESSSGLAVDFSATTSGVCQTGGANGSTLTLLGAGTCTVVAAQAGNPIYRPAASVSQSFAVSASVIRGNVTCQDAAYHGTTIRGRVTVPAGATCSLDGVSVLGGVRVRPGGRLLDTGATIRGSVEANGAAWIDLRGGSIRGGLHVRGTTGMPPASVGDGATANDLCGVDVRGGVTVERSGAGAPFDIGAAPDCTAGLTVHGDLVVRDDAADVLVGNDAVRGRLLVWDDGGAVTVSANTVGGSLDALGNGGEATVSANTVDGRFEVLRNRGAVTVSGNSARGGIQVYVNRGGGSLTNNATRGRCELRWNRPPIAGSGNSAHGRNSCNATR